MSAWPDDTSEHGIGAPDPSRVGGASAFSGILAQMQAEIHPAPYHQYIEPLQEAGIQGGRLVLVGSPRVVAWVARRYAPRLGQLARERMGLKGVMLKGVAW